MIVDLTSAKRTHLQAIQGKLSSESTQLQRRLAAASEFLQKAYAEDEAEDDEDQDPALVSGLPGTWNERYLDALARQISAMNNYATALAERIAIIDAAVKLSLVEDDE